MKLYASELALTSVPPDDSAESSTARSLRSHNPMPCLRPATADTGTTG